MVTARMVTMTAASVVNDEGSNDCNAECNEGGDDHDEADEYRSDQDGHAGEGYHFRWRRYSSEGAGVPRGMHAPPIVDTCSRTVRHPPSRARRGVGRCGCMNAGGQAVGTAVGYGVGMCRPKLSTAAVG